MADIMAIETGRLSLSRITYQTDLRQASGLVIPLGVIAEMTLGTARALGIIARTQLERAESAAIGQLLRDALTKPFDYLKSEFDWAWANAERGRCVETLAARNSDSLLFAPPSPIFIRRPLSSKSELLDLVKCELCAARDKEFKLMMAELTTETTIPDLEESAKLAA